MPARFGIPGIGWSEVRVLMSRPTPRLPGITPSPPWADLPRARLGDGPGENGRIVGRFRVPACEVALTPTLHLNGGNPGLAPGLSGAWKHESSMVEGSLVR